MLNYVCFSSASDFRISHHHGVGPLVCEYPDQRNTINILILHGFGSDPSMTSLWRQGADFRTAAPGSMGDHPF
jgi:hypothetical protein